LTGAPAVPRRHLKLADATAIYAGIILGSGIFVAPAAVAGAVPSIPAAVGLWVLGAVVAACGASCYAECAARVPSNGGFFVFNREAYGPAVAFVSGWTAIFVTYPASIAAIALVFAEYLAKATGMSGWERTAAASALVLAAILNVAGLRTGPRAQIVLTSTKVLVLGALAAAALLAHGRAAPSLALHSVSRLPTSAAAWLFALMIMLFAYDGWSDVTLVAGEVKNPGKNIGRAVLLGTGLLAVLYGLTQVAVMTALPGGRAAASSQPVAAAVESMLGPGAGRGISMLVVVSTFGSIAGTVFTVSRLGFAMAQAGAFLPSAATLHPRWGTPARATAALTSASVAYVVLASFRNILALFTFSVWIFYGITAVALLILRRRGVGEPVAWRAPLGWVPPAVVLAVGTGMTIELVADDPLRALAGALLLAAAFPVYAVIARSGGPRR
jgi:basic amino acid/polyamine antiporter, APA family